MVLAPLCSGGVTHSVEGLPPTPAGTLWAPLSYHGPSEARKRWASPGLPPATPGTEVFQSFQSFSSPKKQARVSLGALIYDTCFACALFSAYSPLRPPHSCAEAPPLFLPAAAFPTPRMRRIAPISSLAPRNLLPSLPWCTAPSTGEAALFSKGIVIFVALGSLEDWEANGASGPCGWHCDR